MRQGDVRVGWLYSHLAMAVSVCPCQGVPVDQKEPRHVVAMLDQQCGQLPPAEMQLSCQKAGEGVPQQVLAECLLRFFCKTSKDRLP